MKTLFETIQKLNDIIDGKQENCRKELIALCKKECEVMQTDIIVLHTYFLNNKDYDETKQVLYWNDEENEFRTKNIDGWGNYINNSRRDNVRIKTKNLHFYMQNIQKALEEYIKMKQEELKAIEFFEKLVKNMKKTEEAV
ncbi:MAG: hypothetical protein WC549_01910 [Actinomycetota bacterium]